MRQREIELLYAYFTNYLTILEGDVITYRNNIRYRDIDAVDCLEMILAIERKNMFVEFSKNVIELLNLRTCDFEEADPNGKR